MSFATPAAFWGLASLLLLILFSLWRQGAPRATVPSLLLWKKLKERNPPVRSLRRPRWRLELLVQALAIVAIVAALAGPYRETEQLQPRRVAMVFDSSPRMRAGGRLEKMKAAAGELLRGKLKHDDVALFAAARRLKDLSELAPEAAEVDLAPLLAAARGFAKDVIVFGDRPVEGAQVALFSAPADNAGIVALSVSDEEIFVRLADHAAPRPLPIALSVDGAVSRDQVPAGQATWFRKGDYRKANAVKVWIEPQDSFPLDDVAEAVRGGSAELSVSLSGRASDALSKVFRAIPGARLVRGAAPLALSVGWDDEPAAAGLRVWIVSPSAPLAGEPAIVAHPLTAGLAPRARELQSLLGALPPGPGQALISVDGKPVATLQGSELRICVDLNEWRKTPSFPIFWTNVADRARDGKGAWTTSGLLDERESDTAGISKPLGWDPGDPTGRERRRQGFGGAAAGAALGLLLLAWLLQLRPE